MVTLIFSVVHDDWIEAIEVSTHNSRTLSSTTRQEAQLLTRRFNSFVVAQSISRLENYISSNVSTWLMKL